MIMFKKRKNKILKRLLILFSLNFFLPIKLKSENQNDFVFNNSNREMVIAIDDHEKIEVILNNSFNIDSIAGAMTLIYLNALFQEAAPILVSKSLVVNILKRKNMLQDFLDLDNSTLYEKYNYTEKFKSLTFISLFKKAFKLSNDIYNNINEDLKKKLKNFNKKDFYDQKSYFNQIMANNVAEIQDFNNELKDYFYISLYKKLFIIDIITNIIIYNIRYENWIAKEINSDFYLLIPKKYLNKFSTLNTDFLHKYNLGNNLTNFEIKLGLKVNHLKDINFSDSKILNYYNLGLKEGFIDALNKVFVTNEDYNNQFKWAFYCSGHGSAIDYSGVALPQLYEFKKYFVKNNISGLDIINSGINYFNYYANSKDSVFEGKIINLKLREFTDFLKFLNSKINTVFLYYSTCFAGGSYLIEPYQENGQPLIFNYDIVCESLNEIYINQDWLSLILPGINDYSVNLNKSKNNINFDKKELKIKTSLKLKKYFKTLNCKIPNNDDSLKKLIYKINPYFTIKDNLYKINNICSLPSIRSKYSSTFKIISGYENLGIIKKADYDNESLNLDNKDFILLYSDYINSINITRDLKVIISMTLNKGHVFENINAIDLNLKEIIDKFLYFKELSCSKFFWIKNLTCKNSYPSDSDLKLTNFIITNNILNLEKLNDFNSFYDASKYDYMYFQNNDNGNDYKIIIPKDYDQNLGLNVQPAKSKNYKTELLLLHPDLKNYLQIL